MKEFVQFAVLGLGLGAVYTLLAQGVVVIYRGSGVVNFAHGAFALIGAIVFTELRQSGTAVVPAMLAAIAAGALVGVLMQNLIMRRLRDAASIARIIATLGVLVAVQSAAALHYGSALVTVGQFLPHESWEVLGVKVGSDRIILFGIGVAVTLTLIVGQRVWLTALATRAAAENELAASTLGWSPNRLATVNWAIGGAMAGAAGALIVPLTGLLVATLTLLVVPALAAALLGRFDSFGGTLLGATGIGIIQSLIVRYWSQTGAADAVPFLVIILVLVITGRSLPLRSHVSERLPSIGRGLIRPVPLLLGFVLVAFCMLFVFNGNWQAAFTVTFAASTVFLSVVVVTGYAGQISLAQYALAGLGAFVAGRLISAQGWPFVPAALAGVIAAIPIGAVFALPALRTRGVNLAVVTLGMGVAVSAMLFNNVDYTGGLTGTLVGDISLFGFDITNLNHPERYGIFVLVAFVLAALAVANLRRSSSGRRMIAIRENERAAASLGVSVVGAKLQAFMIASAIAALGGVLVGFQNTSIIYTNFDPFQSIFAVSYAVIGGVGYIIGPLFGSTLASGGVGSLLNGVLHRIDDYLPLIGGVAVVLVLIQNPDGIVAQIVHEWERVQGWRRALANRISTAATHLPRWLQRRTVDDQALVDAALAAGDRESVAPRTLHIDGLTVRFGAVVAVEDVSLQVCPGEVVGLIGPNGAGKTTLIDAVTGFVGASEGAIRVDEQPITRLPAHRRVRAGIGRSWQSLELFEDVSVRENLQIASESGERRWTDALRGLVAPRRARLTGSAAAAITEFELREDLSRQPEDLPYGRRRLVGIARAVALNPSILLLDEPAAGLSDTETAELGKLLKRLAASWGMGILLVEHDVEMVMSTCDRIVVLNFGRKIAEGTPAEIRNDPAVVAAYLGDDESSGSDGELVTAGGSDEEIR
jgi:sulfate-transporting ATPase